MLLSLSIRQFVIVDELDLDFSAGFTVLTGETGAGKSILIDALLLALGERADADVLREGAARADVTAEFSTGAEVQAWLVEHDLAAEDAANLLLRRVVDAAGRSKAYINGTPATLAQLRELGEQLVDVHGQHAHQSLLRASAQQQMLDEHGGLRANAQAVALAYRSWRRDLKAREDAEQMAASALAEQDRLRWTVEELNELTPVAGEWDAVQSEHKRLSHGASLLEGAETAIDTLSEADDAALTRIDLLTTRLAQLGQYDERLAPALQSLQAARIHIDDAVGELRRYLSKTDLDATRLAEVDARLTALHTAARKFRATPESLHVMLADAQAKLAALTAASDLDALRERESASNAAFMAAASELSKLREAAAKKMAREVTRAMQDLSMSGGRFEVALTPDEPSAQGLERVEFLVAAHSGVTPKPLAKVASGGELARISLAISVIAATATPVATLIFDEVDAGIGGAVAATVGSLLKQLGQMRQVLCVTHLPQVASRADQHLVVAKETTAEGVPVSRIAPLDRRSRVEEIARMLGGAEITETTRKHARELLTS